MDKTKKQAAHPYIPNTIPEVQRQMLDEIGVDRIEDLFAIIPDDIKLNRMMNLPPALTENQLQREIEKLLNKNKSTKEKLNFLGAGCWQHYVPAVCDEINQRSEFVTAYAGEPYEDHGRFQTLFEYQSLVAELVDMDVVNVPTFDWAQAASTALRMSARITGRNKLLLPATIDRDKLMIINNYITPDLSYTLVDYNSETGELNLDDLKHKVDANTAAVYIENPTFLGTIESQGAHIGEIAHEAGALFVVGVDPSSLGVLKPPSQYGADIVCGDLQPLGMHMNYGGGQAGFIATHDKEQFVMEYPSRLFGIAPTSVEGEYGFGDVAYERTSFAHRETGKESVGTQTALWGITAGVYLALMGPYGMQELGQTIMQKSQYAASLLDDLEGVEVKFTAPFFKEFIVDFTNTGLTVAQIHAKLSEQGIQGGKDLSLDFPELGQSALYCVTEIHLQDELEYLAASIQQCVSALQEGVSV
ncbi:aminomethyl-transferring glycine dehydrogenase subunit GcvPA [Paenibacillus sp. N1-5-1-14]|uniref:aminomethyl-transferring glycine dehydrogenase subunit GcvPA n=1 Tax=Paenibacillus radicibacter TaxID=2972488 RepID=UPI0021592FF1|nr:aminomethyl-transferring glycine dehydrogenase subunit GcvPA [Paenibacillus radicibacter]MCR8644702.1 aminomethyl-transferring glycine dehydrogenase subunit GcvPA [Paenibacillus radicibacter]